MKEEEDVDTIALKKEKAESHFAEYMFPRGKQHRGLWRVWVIHEHFTDGVGGNDGLATISHERVLDEGIALDAGK